MYSLDTFLSEYKILNLNNQYRPVAVGRYGIRTRESIYSKELAKDYSKNKLIFKGTLTVGMGSNQMDIGILSDDEVYSVSPAYHTYRITNINYDYLRYCLQCRNKDMFIRFMKRGSRQGKSIDLKRWIKYKIPVYPSKIQLDIVKRLNLVQSIILERKKELDNLEMFVKARFVEMFGDLALNPKNWTQVSLREVCKEPDDIKCGPFGTQLGKDEYLSDGIPVWGIPQINKNFQIPTYDFVSYEKATELSKFSLLPGDIAMSRKGNVGKCAIYPIGYPDGIIHSDVLRIRVDRNICNPIFLMYQLHFSRAVETQINLVSHGAIMAGINVSKLKNIQIHIPSITLQNDFETFVQKADKSKSAIQKSLDETQTLFNSLMQEYFG